jgi:transketolase
MLSNGNDHLSYLSRQIRAAVIENSYKTGTPHLGSCLSCVDILVSLYWNILRIDPSCPFDPNRDRCILSKGHGAPSLLHILALRGFFPTELLSSYGKDGSFFGQHPPAPPSIPGVEAATGSLGHGLSLGIGMALAGKMRAKKYRVFAVLSDGECNEGSVWESALFAAANKIDNLAIIIDFNKWQATGRSCEVMSLNPLCEKWESFGWSACEIDGHSHSQINRALNKVPHDSGKPTAIIAHTIKGKGVSFMEDNNNWHYGIPTEQEVADAKVELGIEKI